MLSGVAGWVSGLRRRAARREVVAHGSLSRATVALVAEHRGTGLGGVGYASKSSAISCVIERFARRLQ